MVSPELHCVRRSIGDLRVHCGAAAHALPVTQQGASARAVPTRFDSSSAGRGASSWSAQRIAGATPDSRGDYRSDAASRVGFRRSRRRSLRLYAVPSTRSLRSVNGGAPRIVPLATGLLATALTVVVLIGGGGIVGMFAVEAAVAGVGLIVVRSSRDKRCDGSRLRREVVPARPSGHPALHTRRLVDGSPGLRRLATHGVLLPRALLDQHTDRPLSIPSPLSPPSCGCPIRSHVWSCRPSPPSAAPARGAHS